MNLRTFGLALVMALSCAVSSAAESLTFTPLAPTTNLVINGGFEAGDLSGWTRVNTVVEGYSKVTGYDPHSGKYAFENFEAIGNISQTLNTLVGQTYDVSFWATGFDVDFTLSLGGNEVIDTLIGGNSSYEKFTGTYTATDTSTTLEIDYNSFASNLDEVVVTPNCDSPPPTVLAILAGGLMGAGWMLQARRYSRAA